MARHGLIFLKRLMPPAAGRSGLRPVAHGTAQNTRIKSLAVPIS